MRAPEGSTAGSRHVLLAGLPAGAEAALAGRVEGARFQAAPGLEEALAQLGRRRWDLAVVDHELPGGSGVDLVGELRGHSRGRAVPVLYCARSDLPVAVAQRLVRDLGVARLFFHPLDLDAVGEQIASSLSRGAPPPADRSASDLTSALAGIWEKFRGVTLERVGTLEAAAAALLSGELDPELRRRAERDAHKLAGSMGTLGFAEASRLARCVERLLEGERPLEEADAPRLSEWVAALRGELVDREEGG